MMIPKGTPDWIWRVISGGITVDIPGWIIVILWYIPRIIPEWISREIPEIIRGKNSRGFFDKVAGGILGKIIEEIPGEASGEIRGVISEKNIS